MSSDPRVAFNSRCELVNASWSLDAGRTVEFRIQGHSWDRLHPFKKFQQRRAGRMGTQFQAVFAHIRSTEQVVMMYRGDAMLAAWGDSSALGQHFKLWLDDESSLHPFAGYKRRKNGDPGDEFQVVLVEVDDEGKPINQLQRDRVEQHAGASHARAGKKLSSQAHLMVTGAMFVRYLQETRGGDRAWTPDLARAWVKKQLGVESLSELDSQSEKARMFHDRIRKPFARWNNQDP